MKKTLQLGTITLSALSLGLAAAAQYSNANPDADPPNRVARVALIEGNVSLEPAGVNDFSAAELNYPLTAGDRIYTDNQSFSELQTAGLAVRLGNGADVTLSSLTDSVAQFGLAQGSLRLRTRDLQNPDGSQAVVEIDTPNGAVLIQQPGDIRIDSYPQDDTTVVTVSSGAVEITGNGLDQQLGPNQSMRLAGNPAYVEPLRLLPADALDRLDQARETERSRELAISAQYVDPGMIGAGDLAQYGDWRPDPDYGGVWFPRNVAADWTPYRNGHWAWVAPWGWTWVEAEPWGFAPFHYGRWASFGPAGNSRWGWVPGPPPALFAGNGSGARPPRPVYSPALVAFVGGPRASISIGFGGGAGAGVTAWFPLGPREAYQPWYHASPGYVNRVNVTNLYTRNANEVRNTYSNRTTNVYNNASQANYINRPQATTAVPQRDFAAGRPAFGQDRLRLDANAQRQLNQAPVLPHPLVTPATAIAQPQQPPRVVPPMQARPVLASGGGQQPIQQPQPPREIRQPGPALGGARSNIYDPRSVQEQAPQPAAGNTAQPTYQRGGFPQQRPQQATPVTSNPTAPVPPSRQNQQSQQQPRQQTQPPAALQGRPAISPVQQMPAQQQTLQPRALPRPAEQPRALVNRTQPQAPQPPFQQQQQAIERHDPGRPLGPQQVENLRQGKPAGQAAQPDNHRDPKQPN